MRHANLHATAASRCLDAVRLTRNATRLQVAPANALVTAAAVLAKALVTVAD